MPTLAISAATLTPFVLLLVAVLGLWIHRFVWMAALAAALVAGCVTGALEPIALVWIALLLGLALAYRRAAAGTGRGAALLRAGCFAAYFLSALAIALVLLPGFPRTTLVADTHLTPGAAPFNLGLGFAKIVGGIFILGIINPGAISRAGLGATLARAAPVFLVTAVVVMTFTLAVGYVRFEPKWTTLFLPWAVANLFFTCVSEEAFFRGFVQHELARFGSNRRVAAGVALVVAAVLFGLAHFSGGWLYVLAASLAGLGYGWAYLRTRRIEASMGVHFALNATHFLLCTYPYALR